MLQSIYTFSFIIAFIYLYISVSVFKKRISVYYIMLFSCVMISNFGYMQMISASTLEKAIQANQTTYLGASFSCVFVLFCCCYDSAHCFCGKKRGFTRSKITLKERNLYALSVDFVNFWYNIGLFLILRAKFYVANHWN